MVSVSTQNNKAVIAFALRQLREKNSEVTLQNVIDHLAGYIISTFDSSRNLIAFQKLWRQLIVQTAEEANINLIIGKITWKSVNQSIASTSSGNDNQYSSTGNDNDDNQSIVSTSSFSSSSSSSSSLKTRLSGQDKAKIKEKFDKLDVNNHWYLEATKTHATLHNLQPESVEMKMRQFALNCNYHHPSQSLILDLNDNHWRAVFTEPEMHELENAGTNITRPLPQHLVDQLNALEKLETPLQAYNFARLLEYDPSTDHLMTWLAHTLMLTSHPLIVNSSNNILSCLESDLLYQYWGFINSIFNCSKIRALGKEKCSVASGVAANGKRKLPAVEPITGMKIGRRMDTIYVAANDMEFGCLEIGKSENQTKSLNDGQIKMPLVMKNMLLRIIKSKPVNINDIHIVGYLISGNKISLLDLDTPQGYVTRIRHMKELAYPSDEDDYIPQITALLRLAATGKTIIEDSLRTFHRTPSALTMSSPSDRLPLPSCFIPSSSSSTSPSSSSSPLTSTQPSSTKSSPSSKSAPSSEPAPSSERTPSPSPGTKTAAETATTATTAAEVTESSFKKMKPSP